MKKAISILLIILTVVCVFPTGITASAETKAVKKVFIAPGHGGKDPGAVANGYNEKDFNLVIALACAEYLSEYGVEVQMSRYTDEDDNSKEAECVAYNPDLAVSIHNNAGGGDGCEVYYSIKGGVSKTLAQNILDQIVAIGQNSRGIKTRVDSKGIDYFDFMSKTKSPAVIVECAFIDNTKDLAIIDTVAEQKAMGVAIAKGILKTLNITEKPLKITYGLVTENEKITADDALAVLQSVVEKIVFTEEQKIAGDVDGNGVINSNDALLILQFVVGKINKFPVEK